MKLNLRPKHHNYTPKQSIPISSRNSPLSPYSGALELQFSPSPFYTFIVLDLMVLYQLESLNLDDYNLTYNKNKNRGFEKKKLTTTPLKLHHFLYTKIHQLQSKPPYTMTSYPIQPQNELQFFKTLLYHIWGFIKPKTQVEMGLEFGFSYLNS